MPRVLILAGDAAEAPEFIRLDPDVPRIVRHFFAEEKPVGTLCHGPQAPAALGFLRGRRSAGFGALAPDIERAVRSSTVLPWSTGTRSRAAAGATSPSGRARSWRFSTAPGLLRRTKPR